MRSSVNSFVLYSRSYCHLCDDMLTALSALKTEFDFQLDIVDVDSDPQLIAIYDDLVPVLVKGTSASPGAMLCHYFLDEQVVRAVLSIACGTASH